MLTLATRAAMAHDRHGGDTPLAFSEAERVAALHDYEILDTPRDGAFDDITRIATVVCGTPMSAINLVDEGRQWLKSEVGLGVTALPMESSICAHAIASGGDLFVVPDLREDGRFSKNPLVLGQPYLRFYAGAQLKTADGHVLGMVCVLDQAPRGLDGAQEVALRALARQVMSQLELRRRVRRAERFLKEMLAVTRELEREGKDLAQAGIAKDDVLAMISHELLTPLAIIEGNVRLSQRMTDESERARTLDEIGVATTRMNRLIANMMVVARDSVGGDVEGEPLLLRVALAAALAEHVRIHPESPVVLDADRDLPPVLADATCLDQIMTNLLSNAARYGDPSEPVTLTAVQRGREVLVTATNGGPVLDPENVERLFAPYFRDAIHRQGTSGIGLGLAVCRRLIEAQGGKIWAVARPAGGLEVCLTLRVADGE